MANTGATSTFPGTSAWGQNIWSSRPNGTVARNISDTGRLQPRPAPLTRPSAPPVNYSQDDDNAASMSEKITGSGSLLSTSEVEPSSRSRWPPMGTTSAPMTGARTLESNVSPMPQRSAQFPRSSSPFIYPQRSAAGQASAPTTSRSVLDPTSQSFNLRGAANTFSPYGPNGDQSGYFESGEDRRSSLGQIQFGSLACSGQSSRAASRNGSLPPSRHGNEFPSQLDNLAAHQITSNISDIFGHRPNQPSRNSTFSNNSNGRNAEQSWQPNLHDLPSALGRMSIDRGVLDPMESGVLSDDGQTIQQENGFNGYVNGRMNSIHSVYRPGSTPFEAENALAAATNSGYNPRVPLQLPSGPTTGRQSLNSPQVFTDDMPSLIDHTRTHSSASNNYRNRSPHTLADNPAWVDHRLQRLQQQESANAFMQNQALQHLQRGGAPFAPSAFGSLDPSVQHHLGLSGQYLATMPGGGFGGYGQTPLSLVQPHLIPRPPPRGPAKEAPQERLRSQLLDAFKDKQNARRWELKDIYHHIVEFSGDQHGSRFIQGKLETANSDEKTQLFSEIFPNALQLMTDVFGNYVVQKFFEHGNQTQKKQLADKMRGHIAELSVQMYGCRVVQKAFEHVLTEQQAILVKELERQVLKCVKDQNGNHVIQKAIQRIPAEHIGFIIDAVTGQVHHLATHTYGCRVVQRLLENSPEHVHRTVLDELHVCASQLILDQFGNYVVQHVIAQGDKQDQAKLHAVLCRQLIIYARHKFASNVVERALEFGTADQRAQMLEIVWPEPERRPGAEQRKRGPDEELPPLQILIRDQFGNYVVQKLLSLVEPPVRESFFAAVRRALEAVRNTTKPRQVEEVERTLNFGPGAGPGRPIRHTPSYMAQRLPPPPHQQQHGPPYPHHHHNMHHPHHPHQPPHSFQARVPNPQHLHGNHNTAPPPPRLDLSRAPTPPLVGEDSQSPQSSSQPSTSSSTMDGPVAGAAQHQSSPSGKPQPVVRVEVADDESITTASVTTPKPT